MNVRYVDHAGRVYRGRLTPRDAAAGDEPPVLVNTAGQPLEPDEVLALLAPSTPNEDQRAGLWQAVQAGYRVETG